MASFGIGGMFTSVTKGVAANPIYHEGEGPGAGRSLPEFHLGQNVYNWIRATQGAPFVLEFRKRSDGVIKAIRCKSLLHQGLSGHGRRYNAAAKNLITVFDIGAGGWRSIPIEGIIYMSMRGEHLPFVDPNAPVHTLDAEEERYKTGDILTQEEKDFFAAGIDYGEADDVGEIDFADSAQVSDLSEYKGIKNFNSPFL